MLHYRLAAAQLTLPPLSPTDKDHVHRMRLALAEAKKSESTPTAFCVGACGVSEPSQILQSSRKADGRCPSVRLGVHSGCIITSASGTILSSGYSRELPGNTHAEQCAIDKLGSPAASASLLEGASMYTTMEPCSLRLSGNMPCVQRVLQTGIKTVYIGVQEPTDFVECEGTRLLLDCKREVYVVEDPGLAEECLKVARGGK